MDANGTNAAQLQKRPMLRSQGPLYPLDTTHLNPSNCYVRSYDCHKQCNVNTSYNTVSLSIKEKRRKLVTEISTLLGHFSGHWYARDMRPHDLSKHPMDWSTVLLKQFFHRNMLATATEGTPSGPDSSAKSDNKHDAKEPTHTSEHAELERLQADNQRLVKELHGINEELEVLKTVEELQNSFLDDHLAEAEEALTTCSRECEVWRRQSVFESHFENLLSKEELQALNGRYEKAAARAKEVLGFT